MSFPTEIFGDVIVVHTPDDVNEDFADQFSMFIMNLDQTKVIVDLDRSESFKSEGLEALLDAQDALRLEQGDLKVMTTSHVNRKILEITRLEVQLEVFDSVIDAVKSFV
jgi:anti-sigma B factor antagonist